MERFQLTLQNGLWLGTFTHFEKQGLRHAVSTRLGGVSAAPFNSLDLGLHTGDDAERVKENRRRFAAAAGVELARAATAEQVHGDKVFIVTEEHAGCGAEEYSQAIPGVDALVTQVPGIPLMLFFADCVPVLIVDPVKQVIAVSHAGWKGTAAGIAAKTIGTMAQKFSTRPEDCLAGIGPSVGPCCYEVNETVVRQFTRFNYWQELFSPRGDRWQLDLWAANRRQLIDAGLKDENIVVSGICTACHTELFYSYRAEEGRTGRIGAILAL